MGALNGNAHDFFMSLHFSLQLLVYTSLVHFWNIVQCYAILSLNAIWKFCCYFFKLSRERFFKNKFD